MLSWAFLYGSYVVWAISERDRDRVKLARYYKEFLMVEKETTIEYEIKMPDVPPGVGYEEFTAFEYAASGDKEFPPFLPASYEPGVPDSLTPEEANMKAYDDAQRLVMRDNTACLACPIGCPECSNDEATCECYQHADLHPDNEPSFLDQ